ncbi:MAG: tRNA lysidine(34) synthetase TilS [Ruminococcus sp.]|nr:tRNA lysidine(34) synthetase TilS [Ruminococcus sp.]
MNHKMLKALNDFSMLFTGDTVVVALSGGADSVALLHALISLKEEYNLTVKACHLNHQIRGEEADFDEQFVKDLCKKLNVELFLKRVDVVKMAKEQKESLELCGRRARYEFFRELNKEHNAKIATAHTASDNVETVLYNIARGTSLNGLCGIKPVRDYIIRPLIYSSREDVEKYCLDNALDFVTDSTNLTDDYTRNNIRHNAVPVLKGINPDLCDALSRMCKGVYEVKEFVDNYSLKALKEAQVEHGYSCEKLLKLSSAVLNNALYILLSEHCEDVTNCHIELVRDALKSGGCVDLKNGKRAVCKQGVLRITDCAEKSKTDIFEQIPFKNWDKAEYISKEELKNINKKLLINCIDCDIITDDTVVRTKKAGDTFTFSDRAVTKSLKKLFNELKIPAEKRSSVLLVANGSTVLWLQGVGVSKHGMVKNDHSGAYKIMGVNYD